jgi:hypothetical protein
MGVLHNTTSFKMMVAMQIHFAEVWWVYYDPHVNRELMHQGPGFATLDEAREWALEQGRVGIVHRNHNHVIVPRHICDMEDSDYQIVVKTVTIGEETTSTVVEIPTCNCPPYQEQDEE